MRGAAVLLLGLWGCSSGPQVLPNAADLLEEVAAMLVAGDAASALALLEAHDPKQFPGHQDRYELLMGTALLDTGESWDAFQAIRDFADQHPHSDLRSRVVQVEFEIGRQLAQSGSGFLFFWSDRRGARTVLEHLITRYPENLYLADALRILGDMAFDSGDHALAQARYRDLLRRRPESEWVPLARYRYAMSIYARQRGPEYDLDQMQHASRELEEFLQNPPENPRFVADAREALATLREWQAERYLLNAEFYRTLGNEPGQIYNLRMAATRFPDTEGGRRAGERLTPDGSGGR